MRICLGQRSLLSPIWVKSCCYLPVSASGCSGAPSVSRPLIALSPRQCPSLLPVLAAQACEESPGFVCQCLRCTSTEAWLSAHMLGWHTEAASRPPRLDSVSGPLEGSRLRLSWPGTSKVARGLKAIGELVCRVAIRELSRLVFGLS